MPVNLDPDLLSILVCPKCRSPFEVDDAASELVCTNPECGFNLRIDNGEISFGRAIGQSYK